MTSTEPLFHNNVLEIAGNKIELQNEIWKVIETSGAYMVLTYTKKIGDDNRNVFLIDRRGKILWQIEAFMFGEEPTFYTNIWISEKGNLMAFNRKGYECTIDKETGKILETEFTK